MKPGLYDDISNHDYHNSAKCNALSAGGIKSLLQSPAHFVTSQNNTGSATPALIFGQAAHSMILEPEKDDVIIPPDVDKRTKAGRAEYAEFLETAGDKIVIDQSEYDTICAMRNTIDDHDTASMLLEQGKAEVSAFWNHPEYGFLCKCRPDFMVSDMEIILDYKTCIDASVEGFGRAANTFRYDAQAAWYMDGLEEVTGKRYQFIFIAQEKSPPYAVAVYRVDQDIYRKGKRLINEACGIYSECLKTGKWGAYPDRIQNLTLPYWAK